MTNMNRADEAISSTGAPSQKFWDSKASDADAIDVQAVPRPFGTDGTPHCAPLAVEPDLFHAHAVVDAVDHRRVALHVGLPAGAGAVVVEHRARHVLGEPPLDVPHQVLALLWSASRDWVSIIFSMSGLQ